jgi:predicted RNA methylase
MLRARYYLRRLKAALEEPKFGIVNDINLRRWKEYDDVWTDSLWVMGRRDNSGAHKGWYWGNFVPQIPRQMMLRYTKSGEWVLDAFAGSGTTLIECRKLGRNGLGIELNHQVTLAARRLVNTESNPKGVRTEIVEGDSATIDLRDLLSRFGIDRVQMVIMHPPYHDIIKFSDDPRDLSSARDTEDFLMMFDRAVDNVTPSLAQGRYFILVIGDKFARGEWIPLGFLAMDRILRRGDFRLKGIVVKNFDETRGKRSQHELWRYRALAGGFYIFKHEYVFVFQKKDL